MGQTERASSNRMTRRTAIAASVALVAAGGVARIAAQTPEASPVATPSASPAATPGASPVASPAASPVASPAASPAATPVPDYPLDIYRFDELPDDGEPVGGGTLRLPVRSGGLTDFVPTTQRQDPQVAWSYLDALVRIDPETALPAPGLATKWASSDDGLELTFTLRKGVEWHDGSPFTAEDVRFTHFAYRDDYRSVVAAQSALVDDIVADGGSTVHFRFSEPDGAWLFNVASLPVFQARQYQAHWEARPVGERTLEGIGFDGEAPTGTGPWMIDTVSVEGIGLVPNEAYFDTPPFAGRLELVALDDPADRLKRWEDGNLHSVSRLNPQLVEGLLETEGRLIVTGSPRALFAVYNFENLGRAYPQMLAEPKVREALGLAIDRNRYAEDIWGGFLRADQAGIVAQRWADDAERKNPKQEVRKARQILMELGWADLDGDGFLDNAAGDSLRLTTVVLDTAEPAVLDTLAAIDEDLREIGAGLDIQVVPQDRFVTIWSEERMWDLLVYDLRLYPAFAEFDLVGSAWDIRVNQGGWNPGGYVNERADEALQAWFAAVKPNAMEEALKDLQAAIVDDPLALWLGYPEELVLLSPEVRGFVPNPLWPTLDTRLMWLDA